MWFPTTSSIHDLHLHPASILSVDRVLELLNSKDRLELKEKTGVTGGRDGSARATTRLLESEGWIFKTEVNLRHQRFSTVWNRVREQQAQQDRLVTLWHPSKVWFALRHDNEWYPISLCPKLYTLRSIKKDEELLKGWVEMLKMGVITSIEEGVGLDLNPSNFGYSDGGRLYYIDDELLPASSLTDLGEVLAARIPQHPECSKDFWREFGLLSQEMLAPLLTTLSDWRELQEGVQNYPLTDLFKPRRDSLVLGLVQGNIFLDPRVRRRRRKQKKEENKKSSQIVEISSTETPTRELKAPSRQDLAGVAQEASSPRSSLFQNSGKTCIFSDIHGNYPALEKVLEESQKLGADTYLCLGDIVGYGPYPKECVQRMRELENAIILKGNHDAMIAEGSIPSNANRLAREVALWSLEQLTYDELDWLEQLQVEYREGNWLAVHSSPQDETRLHAYVYELTYRENLDLMKEMGVQVCFYGHTHVAFGYGLLSGRKEARYSEESLQLFDSDRLLLLNPGSVGQPRDRDNRASFAIWDHSTNLFTWHRVTYDVQKTIQAITHHGLAEDLGVRLEMGW